MRQLKEIDRESFFNSDEADLINDLLIDIAGRASLGAVLKSLGYNYDEVLRAKEVFKIAYRGF